MANRQESTHYWEFLYLFTFLPISIIILITFFILYHKIRIIFHIFGKSCLIQKLLCIYPLIIPAYHHPQKKPPAVFDIYFLPGKASMKSTYHHRGYLLFLLIIPIDYSCFLFPIFYCSPFIAFLLSYIAYLISLILYLHSRKHIASHE